MTAPLDPFSEVVDEQRRWTRDWYSWLAEQTTPLIKTATGLPPANRAGVGARAYVTDSSVTLSAGHGATVAGGGVNFVPVFSDGTNWKIG